MLLTKLKQKEKRLQYAQAPLTHGWSRNVLVHHIELRTTERQGRAMARIGTGNADLGAMTEARFMLGYRGTTPSY